MFFEVISAKIENFIYRHWPQVNAYRLKIKRNDVAA